MAHFAVDTDVAKVAPANFLGQRIDLQSTGAKRDAAADDHRVTVAGKGGENCGRFLAAGIGGREFEGFGEFVTAAGDLDDDRSVQLLFGAKCPCGVAGSTQSSKWAVALARGFHQSRAGPRVIAGGAHVKVRLGRGLNRAGGDQQDNEGSHGVCLRWMEWNSISWRRQSTHRHEDDRHYQAVVDAVCNH
jgi:hypothetical protein